MIISLSVVAAVVQAQQIKMLKLGKELTSREIVEYLASDALQGRLGGTKGDTLASDFIYAQMKKLGLNPVKQEFTVKRGNVVTFNVYGKVEGSTGKYIVIGAHYDHLGYKEGVGIHPGADDNASGIVALLSLAKIMKESGIVPEYTVLFCAWDGEEKGLLGSKYFVRGWPHGKQPLSSLKETLSIGSSLKESVVCYMNFDMVGRTITPENPAVTFAWNNNYPYLLDICKEVQKSIPAPFQVLLDERRGDGKGGSDYAPFSALDIPFIAWMEDFMHEDYHKPTDTQDKIHWEKLRKTTLLAYGILFRLATGAAQ